MSRRIPNRPRSTVTRRRRVHVSRFDFFSAEDPVIAELRMLDVNALSLLVALNKLYELQQ